MVLLNIPEFIKTGYIPCLEKCHLIKKIVIIYIHLRLKLRSLESALGGCIMKSEA